MRLNCQFIVMRTYTFKCPKCGGTDLTCAIAGVTEVCSTEIDSSGNVYPGDTIELCYNGTIAVYICDSCGAEFEGSEAVKPFITNNKQSEEQ